MNDDSFPAEVCQSLTVKTAKGRELGSVGPELWDNHLKACEVAESWQPYDGGHMAPGTPGQHWCSVNTEDGERDSYFPRLFEIFSLQQSPQFNKSLCQPSSHQASQHELVVQSCVDSSPHILQPGSTHPYPTSTAAFTMES